MSSAPTPGAVPHSNAGLYAPPRHVLWRSAWQRSAMQDLPRRIATPIKAWCRNLTQDLRSGFAPRLREELGRAWQGSAMQDLVSCHAPRLTVQQCRTYGLGRAWCRTVPWRELMQDLWHRAAWCVGLTQRVASYGQAVRGTAMQNLTPSGATIRLVARGLVWPSNATQKQGNAITGGNE